MLFVTILAGIRHITALNYPPALRLVRQCHLQPHTCRLKLANLLLGFLPYVSSDGLASRMIHDPYTHGQLEVLFEMHSVDPVTYWRPPA